MLTINTPPFLVANVPGDLQTPSLDVTFSHDKAQQRYMPVSVKIENPMSPFTVTAMKKMRVHRLSMPKLREQLINQHNTDLLSHAPIKAYARGKDGRAIAQKAHLNPSEQQLTDAVLIYGLASAIRDFPVKAIEKSFGLDNDEARNWLKLARKKGMLA